MQNKSMIRFFPWLMVLLGGVFYCYEYMVRIAPSIMIPELMKSFQIEEAQIGLLSATYYWGYVTGSLIVGPMIDRFAPKRVILCATVICALGCFLFSMSQSLLFLQASRLVIGFGSAFAFIGLLSIGAMWLSPNCFGRLAGTSSMLGMISAMIGQNSFSRLMNHYSWQSISLYSAIVGLLIAVFLFTFLKDKPRISTPYDIKTSFTLKEMIETFKKIGKQSSFWRNCLIGLTTFLPIIVFSELWGVPFLQNRYGVHRDIAAHYVSMVFMGWAFGGPFFGFLFDKFQSWRNIFYYGTLIAVLTAIIILYVFLPITLLPYLLFIFGFAASSHVLVFVSSKKMAPRGVEATALGITNLLMMSAGIIVQPVIGSIIQYLPNFMRLMTGITMTPTQSYQVALTVLPLALLWTLVLINRVGKSLPPQERETPARNLLWQE